MVDAPMLLRWSMVTTIATGASTKHARRYAVFLGGSLGMDLC